MINVLLLVNVLLCVSMDPAMGFTKDPFADVYLTEKKILCKLPGVPSAKLQGHM